MGRHGVGRAPGRTPGIEALAGPEADARTGFASEDQLYPYLALQYGIGLITWMRDWFAQTAEQLAAGTSLLEIQHDEAAGGEARLGPAG